MVFCHEFHELLEFFHLTDTIPFIFVGTQIFRISQMKVEKI